MDERLLGAIGTPSIQSQASETLRRAMAALDGFGRLDESLFERFVATRESAGSGSLSEENLRSLWEETFRGLLELLAFLRELGKTRPQDGAAEDSLNFDFGDMDGGTPPPAGDDDIGMVDIGGLLENIDSQAKAGDPERWALVLETVSSISYGLQAQYDDALERMGVALGAGKPRQVLALMDDAQGAASEGVHALVTAIYEAFLPDVDPATILPGYLTLLGRALLVRRALSDLASRLGPMNDALQGQDPVMQRAALSDLQDAVGSFVASAACRAMRPPDRWQLLELTRSLRDAPLAIARQTSEGLVKYLESLGAINQREVLIKHDERAIAEMGESLSSARQLMDLSPTAASDQLERAYRAALSLRGRRLNTDRLLTELEREGPRLRREGQEPRLLERLEAVLVATSG